MKIKQTLLILALVFGSGLGVLATNSAVLAADCSGVETSIIDCDDDLKGVCADGTNPYEGAKPDLSNPEASKAYEGKYLHAYGYCDLDGTVRPNTDISSTGLWGVLLLVINILTGAVGIAAVGGVVYGSILYASSGGNAEQTKKGMETIRNTIIGMVLYALMYAFLNFIIPGGLFI